MCSSDLDAAHAAADLEHGRLHAEDWRSAEADLIDAQALHAQHRDGEARALARHSAGIFAAALPPTHRLRREVDTLLAALPASAGR